MSDAMHIYSAYISSFDGLLASERELFLIVKKAE